MPVFVLRLLFYDACKLLDSCRGRGHVDYVEEKHVVNAFTCNEIGKVARPMAVVDNVNVLVGVNEEGNEGITVGFLDHYDR